MTLPATIKQLGAPDYGVRKGTEFIVFHTPEFGGFDLASAIACAKWQTAAGNTSGGSYNGFPAFDASRGFPITDWRAWVMVESVPFSHIAGGLPANHNQPAWRPDRYPWIKQTLSSAAYADCNAYCIQLSVSGTTAALVKLITDGKAGGLITFLAKWVKSLEVEYHFDAALTGHFMFQTDRTDPGTTPPDKLLCDLVLEEYLKQNAPAPAVAAPVVPVDWAGKINPIGTRYPLYIHSDYQALFWITRAIAASKAAGRFRI